jgi:4-amino-4-deoxy-L-arabinose transferase-like glycosyltransferase
MSIETVKTYFNTHLLISANTRYLLFLIGFGLFTLLFNLGGRSLENKDTVSHPEVAREILESGDWVMLRQNGDIYVDKPPLHFWLAAISYTIFGVSPFAARIPEEAAAFCGILLCYFFAKRILGNSERAFLAAIILLSAIGYLWWGRRTRSDIEFSILFAMSLIFFYYGCEADGKTTKTFWYAAFWLATGCAFMTKAFIVFTNLAVVIPCAILTMLKPEDRRVSPLLWVMTCPFLAIPVLPWILSLWKHVDFPQYWDIFEMANIATRDGGLFHYFADLPIKLFPGIPFILVGLWAFVNFRKQLLERRNLGFVFLWFGSYFFILQLTSVKDTRYLIPIYLPCSIIGAWAITFLTEKHPACFGRIMRYTDRIFLIAAALSLTIPFFFAYYLRVSLLAPWPYVVCLGVVLLLTRMLLPSKAAGIFVSFIILFLSIEAGDAVVDREKADFRQISQTLKKHGLSSKEVALFNCANSSKNKVR